MSRKKVAAAAPVEAKAVADSAFTLQSKNATYDKALTDLFASSSGPVLAPPKPSFFSRPQAAGDAESGSESSGEEQEEDDEELSMISEDDDQEDVQISSESEAQATEPTRKRKRKAQDEDLEANYLNKLAEQEAKEEAERRAAKRQKAAEAEEGSSSEEEEDEDDDKTNDLAETEDMGPIPVHESLAPSQGDVEMDKASRTCFLGNVSTEAIKSKTAKKTLMAHLASFIPHLTASGAHKVESFRFRSTAFSTPVPKKAAFARREIMDETTHSTNAYVVYSTETAAREAANRLNGSVVLGRHLRVDSVAHPAKVDNRRCVFVGNLGFVDDETEMVKQANSNEKTPRKKAQKGDVEEGLWQQMSKAGRVESVRVVRDPKTRVGKGIAYVQFEDGNAVEAALLFNDKKFPPLLPRKLRVVRAKRFTNSATSGTSSAASARANNPNTAPVSKKRGGRGRTFGPPSNQPSSKAATNNEATLNGRVQKLLGRAGAAQARDGQKIKPPESFVFEGHRATSSQGNGGLRLGGSGKKKGGKPRNRSTKRAEAWKMKAKAKPGKAAS